MLRLPQSLAALFFSALWCPAQENVLIVVADDLGVEQLSFYGIGLDLPPTPTLDELAARGVVFRNAWASPLCSPARAALQTGRYGFHNDVGWLVGLFDLPLAQAEVTLPEMLDAATGGVWSHAMIGKWHLAPNVGDPNDQGYDWFAGTLGNLNGTQSYTNWNKVENGATSISNTYATSEQVDDALSFIGGASEPWLCVLAFSAPHAPFHAPPSDLTTIDLAGLNPATDPRPFYKAAVEAMDSELGRLLDSLDPGVLSRTNVFFLADNGTPPEVITAPFNPEQAKATLYQGGIAVPLIAAGPRVALPGRTVDALVSVVDLFETVGQIAGVSAERALPPGEPLDSQSLLPYLELKRFHPQRTHLYTDRFLPNDFDQAQHVAAAIRDSRYKLIVDDQAAGDELYDLAADPFEAANLLGSGPTLAQLEAYRSLKKALARLWSAP